MALVTETASGADPRVRLLGSLAVAVVVGAGLAVSARESALALLIAVAAAQALLVLVAATASGLPGRVGAVLIGAAAAVGSDVVVSVWPHGKLGTLLVVFGLSIPLMFVHQLARSAGRVRVVESLSATAVLVVLVTALAAYVQLRHEFVPSTVGAHIVGGVLTAAAGALVIGYLVDMVMPAPRFDPAIPRGLLAVIAAGGLGGSVGHLAINDGTQFDGARGTFVGAAIGALVGFFAVGAAFVDLSAPPPAAAIERATRAAQSVLAPIALVGPVAFLLCLAVRS